jgi:hypothetical protein
METVLNQIKALLANKTVRLPLFILMIGAVVVWGFIKRKRLLGGLLSTKRRIRRRTRRYVPRRRNYVRRRRYTRRRRR